MTTLALTRLLDRLEHLVWESQDRRLRAAGFEVTRIGRWRRAYRRAMAIPSAGSVRTAAAGGLAVRTGAAALVGGARAAELARSAP
jgi:hypothetical protein